jgi:hypothetical protein
MELLITGIAYAFFLYLQLFFTIIIENCARGKGRRWRGVPQSRSGHREEEKNLLPLPVTEHQALKFIFQIIQFVINSENQAPGSNYPNVFIPPHCPCQKDWRAKPGHLPPIFTSIILSCRSCFAPIS